jgi:thiol-disulfide isomerase/thioredoxin
VRAALIAVLLGTPASAHAGRATCSNPGVPVGSGASRDLLTGQLSFTLSSSFLPIHSEETVDEGLGSVLLDQDVRVLETRFAGEYTVLPWLAITGAFPYRVIDVDLVRRDPMTSSPMPGATDIHARSETLNGLGDPSVGVHVFREVGGWRLHARTGTSIPVGKTEEDPHLLGSIGQEHQHIQLGTGTFIPYVAVEGQRSFGTITGAVWALTHQSLVDNDEGYRAGDRYSLGLTATSGFGLKTWSFATALEGHAETAETWNGMVYEEEGNAGRFDLMVGVSAAWRPLPQTAVIVDVKRVVYSQVDGTQLDFGFLLGVGIAGTFETRKRPSYRGLDEKPIAPAGEAADLIPVLGKITVFDLWASWCAPCRELDDKLVVLAKQHPELAIRKLEVVDSDSAAWKKHLAPGAFELPHLKVYGADGKLLFEKTAPPTELIRALEAVLSR